MSMEDIRHPAFLGALLDVLSRCIDREGPNSEKTEGIYNGLLAEAVARGAYDANGARNATFLGASNAGPYPQAMRYAWSHIRLDAAHNRGLNLMSAPEEWGKLGSLAMETPADVRNRELRKCRGSREW
jgi:hypothetical protein